MTEDSAPSPGFASARGAVYLLAKALAASASSAILFAYVASTLPSVSDLGLFQGTQSIIVVGVILGGSGLSRAAIRFISTQIGAGNEEHARNLYALAFRIGVILSGVVAAGIYLLSSFISLAVFHDTSYQVLMQLASLDVFLFSMIILSVSLMYSMQEFRRTSIISIINSVLKTVSAVVLLAAGFGIEGIVWGFIVGDAIAFGLFLFLLKPRLLLRNVSHEGTIPLLRFSLPLFGSSILDFLAREIDVYLLLVIASLYVAGIYSPAIMLAGLLFLLQTSLDQALAPFFSRVYGKSGVDPLFPISRTTSKFVFLVYFPIGFAFFGFVPIIFSEILGERYSEAIIPSMLVVGAVTCTSMIAIFNNVLLATGRSRIFLSASIIALCSQLALSLVLIPSIGAVGAAIGKAASYSLLFAIPAYQLKRLLGLSYDKSALLKGISVSAIIALLTLALNALFSTPYLIPVTLSIDFMVYLLFLRVAKAVEPEDLQLLDKVLSGRAKNLIMVISRVAVK